MRRMSVDEAEKRFSGRPYMAFSSDLALSHLGRLDGKALRSGVEKGFLIIVEEAGDGKLRAFIAKRDDGGVEVEEATIRDALTYRDLERRGGFLRLSKRLEEV